MNPNIFTVDPPARLPYTTETALTITSVAAIVVIITTWRTQPSTGMVMAGTLLFVASVLDACGGIAPTFGAVAIPVLWVGILAAGWRSYRLMER